ncbi:MAG TPA: FAD-dependent oxidoreductase [bacterium]|nr:FAD-dependent oxidoreductase [bacterium]
MKYVIIGAGVAGIAAAKTIRSVDSVAEIVLVGKENYLPYRRHRLTEFLCQKVDQQQLYYMSCEDFRALNIHFRKGQSAKFIHPERKCVQLAHNEIINYDRLLIATGGCPQTGPAMRSFAKHLHRYYDLTDVLLLKRNLPNFNHCIVSGSGLSSLDLMAALRNLGKKVTYLTPQPRAQFPLLEQQFANDVHQFLEQQQIDIITHDRIIGIEKKDGKYQVITLNGNQLLTDLVFGWDYYQPDIGWIETTGIDRKTGILVDLHLRTSVEDIFAAGDCVEIYHPVLKNYWINFGRPNAEQQGEIAARNMTGQNVEYQIQDTIVFNLMGKPLTARWWE